MSLPELGVGLTWFSALGPVLDENPGLIDLIEIEPQTFWRRDPVGGKLVVDQPMLHELLANPLPKLIHGIGFPVGGTRPPTLEELNPLRDVAVALQVPWLSEHLSFNLVGEARSSHTHRTSFLLPPRQTAAGVTAAARSIRAMAERMPVPVAIETGVNYLGRRPDELPDGEFVDRVVRTAECGILLDLHNIWTNERNGRQRVSEYLGQISLDRVWEIHLAGGSEHNGYWLDAHSGAIPDELLQLAEQVIPRLPNLKAIIFELFPAYLPTFGMDMFRSQLESMHHLWTLRGITQASAPRRSASATSADRPPSPREGLSPCVSPSPCQSVAVCEELEPGECSPHQSPSLHEWSPSPREWEDTLGGLVTGGDSASPLARELKSDPGIPLIRELIGEFRASMIVRTLRLSTRLIMLERGREYLDELLADFYRANPPQSFASEEADAFTAFLRERRPDVPFLDEVLEYDRAVISVALEGKEKLLPFHADPLPLLRALGEGRRPVDIQYGNFEVLLLPDAISEDAELSALQVIH
ncbi:MAG TPA: DUF692 family protein [Silvibacterium sp.]|nr:DUF692 family protein [Silvibacterium sp.]